MNHLPVNEDSIGDTTTTTTTTTANELTFKSIDEHIKMNYLNKHSSHFSQISSPPTSPSSFNSSLSPPSLSLDESSTIKPKIISTNLTERTQIDIKAENDDHSSQTSQNEKSEQTLVKRETKSNNTDRQQDGEERVANFYINKNVSIEEPRKKYEKIHILSPSNTNKLNSSNNSLLAPTHKCKECFRTFKDINNYKEHRFQEHHSTEFPNVRKCSMCSYATLLKSKYDCHMRCHLNNKVIKCHRCSYSTINIRHMSRHERMHMVTGNLTASSNGVVSSSDNHSKYLNKLTSNALKNKVHKKDAKLKAELKLKKKKRLSQLFDATAETSVEKNKEILKSTSSNQSSNDAAAAANNESLYNLSMVAAATIAAINSIPSNNQSSSSTTNTIKNQFLNDLNELEKNSSSTSSSSNLVNLEIIKNMLLNQIENKKKFKLNEDDSSSSSSSGNTHSLSDRENSTLVISKYPSPPSSSNVKFNISSSITPPLSASSVGSSSMSSSPNERKTSESYIQSTETNNVDLATTNAVFYPNFMSNPTIVLPTTTTPLTKPNVYSIQNEYSSTHPHHHSHSHHLQQPPQHQASASAESLALYQSNIEHLIKLQTMYNFNNANSSNSNVNQLHPHHHNNHHHQNTLQPFFNTFLPPPNESNSISSHCNMSNFHIHSSQQQQQQQQQHQQYLQEKRKYELTSSSSSGPLKHECDSENSLVQCRHRFELEKLRINVYKLIFNLMPQLIQAFNLDFNSVHNTTHIDTLIDYLINNQNNHKANHI